MIAAKRLRELVLYNPETGIFTSKVFRANHKPGDILGAKNAKGYCDIMIERKHYRANRLAWLYMTGEWPEKGSLVDHINRVRDDNRWANLRLATDSQNAINAKLSKRNSSGHKGIYWYERHGKWNAQIRVNRKLLSLGYYSDIEQAIAARQSAEVRYFGEFSPTAQ